MGKYNLKLEFDVVDIFKSNNSNKNVFKSVSPILANPNFRQEYGRRLIDKIKERTQSGVNKNGRSFKQYSQSYKESLVYEIYGKTSQVNLTLTGEMLASMQVASTPSRKVVINFASSEQEAKAHGHIFGGGYKRNLPVRDFFGLPKKDQYKILEETIKDFGSNTTIFDVPNVSESISTLFFDEE